MDIDFYNQTISQLLKDTKEFHSKIVSFPHLRNLYATMIEEAADCLTRYHENTEPFEKMLVKFNKLN